MKNYLFLSVILFCLISCKTGPGADRQYEANNGKRVYKLNLNPTSGSEYEYEIINESNVNMEVDDKKVDNVSKSEVVVLYTLNKDSAGNFLLSMQYKKVHIYTKTGETETDINTDNTAATDDPVEKMIGILKNAAIEATVNPLGEIISVKGYDEIADKIISGLNIEDAYTKNIARARWQQAIGEGVIKKNMSQLFKIFPDSAVHVGDKWKLNSTQDGELGFNIKSFYTLKHMNDEVAVIASEGEIGGDNATINVSGNLVKSNLKGTQEGEYRVELKTGMMSEGEINSKVEGTLQMMGKEIPITVKSEVKIKGKKIR